MHLILAGIALALAGLWRQLTADARGTWQQRWRQSLVGFVLPPLLLVGAALSIVLMGASGHMWGMPASKLSSLLAIAFMSWLGLVGLRSLYLSLQDERRLRAYPQEVVTGETVRLVATDIPASAYVGVWKPEILLTDGLMAQLDTEQMQAVLAHERAHAYYRDTFWFFWLGCLRTATAWLPRTEALWQELLLLRELRADRRASLQSDALALAEALVTVARYPVEFAEARCAPLSCATSSPDRLQERVEALLSAPAIFTEDASSLRSWAWRWLAIALLPLAILPFHCHC